MRRKFLVAAFFCASVSGLNGQKAASKSVTRALSSAAPATGSLSVRLVTLPEGVTLTGSSGGTWDLDLGDFSYFARPRKSNVSIRQLPSSFIVASEFGVQIQNSAPSAGTATLLALLQASQARYTIRIDGVPLASSPTPVAPHIAMGIVTRHRLEIEFPLSLNEKDAHLYNAIQFSVIPN